MVLTVNVPAIVASLGINISPVTLSAYKMLATFMEASMNNVSSVTGSIGAIVPPIVKS